MDETERPVRAACTLYSGYSISLVSQRLAE